MNLVEYYGWLKKEWAKVGFIVSLFLFPILIIGVRPHDYVLYILLLQTPIYMLHETEEFVFPGGFGKYFNHYIFRLPDTKDPLDENFVFYVNIGIVWLALPIFGLLSSINYMYGLWIPYFVIIAGLLHIGIALKTHRFYNPGLVVSLTLNIPVGIWSVYQLVEMGVLNNYVFNIYLLIGLVVNLSLPIMGYRLYKKSLGK